LERCCVAGGKFDRGPGSAKALPCRATSPRHPAVPSHRGGASSGEAALWALDLAISAIDAPAVVVDLGGTVLHANSNAATLFARDRQGVSRSLVQAIAGVPADLDWDLTPLRSRDKRHAFLAILRGPRRGPRVANSLPATAQRWRLTPRPAQVLDLVARGFTNALIADELGIGEGTVEFHLSAIFDKAGVVESRAMLIARVHSL
jgi:DNA-binding CsgD family transcriptional regulator